jgi:uncharacterized protein YbjT (DUF2867 family)
MRVVVVGAGGFIGSRIVVELLSRDHSVVCAGRAPEKLLRRFPACEAVDVNLAADDVDKWRACLGGVDAVINAIGVLRGDLETVHHRGPVRLFDACAQAGVPHLLQISALGASVQNDSRFLATKYAADLHLLRLAEERGMRGWSVLRPSLVVGRGGASTELFSGLAAAIRPVRLGNGTWLIQPIHVADVARAVATLIEQPHIPSVIDVVGPEAMTTDGLTASLRAWLGLPTRRFITLPLPLISIGARVGDLLPGATLTTEALTMLARGNTADVAPAAAALGWMPHRLSDALAAEPSVRADLWQARMMQIRNILRGALAAVWIGSGVASFAVSPERADALLSRLTSDRFTAMAITWSGAALDVALGAALLHRSWRRRALQGQLAVMLAYTVLATIALPELWMDPFGSLLKNLAVLAATLALLAVED